MNPDELMKIIKDRRSVRKYLPDVVPKDIVEKIIEAAIWAPSGSNSQNWHFIVIRTKELKEQLLDIVNAKAEEIIGKIESPEDKDKYLNYCKFYTFFVQAPVLIAVVKKPYNSISRKILEKNNISYAGSADVQGPAAAIQNMLLMAQALGYGTCWMTGPMIARKEIEEALVIKEPDELMALIPLGKQADVPGAPKRRSVVEVVSYK